MRDVREPLRLAGTARPRTVPGRQTRERSLRPRSTSITCSARSFSRGEQPLRVAARRAAVEPGDRVHRRARALELHERLGRGADEREAVELEQEEVRRRVDPPQRPVDRERRGAASAAPRAARGRSGTRRRARMCSLQRSTPRSYSPASGTAHASRPPARAPPAAAAATARSSSAAIRRRVAARAPPRRRARGRSGRACRRRRTGSPAVRGRRPAAARSARASRRGRSRGSRRRARRAPRPRRTATRRDAAADERVAAEAALLDRLEQEARAPRRAQVEVGPERSEEIGVEDGCVMFTDMKNDPLGSSVGAVRAVGASCSRRAGSRPARCARPTQVGIERDSSSSRRLALLLQCASRWTRPSFSPRS